MRCPLGQWHCIEIRACVRVCEQGGRRERRVSRVCPYVLFENTKSLSTEVGAVIRGAVFVTLLRTLFRTYVHVCNRLLVLGTLPCFVLTLGCTFPEDCESGGGTHERPTRGGTGTTQRVAQRVVVVVRRFFASYGLFCNHANFLCYASTTAIF